MLNLSYYSDSKKQMSFPIQVPASLMTEFNKQLKISGWPQTFEFYIPKDGYFLCVI